MSCIADELTWSVRPSNVTDHSSSIEACDKRLSLVSEGDEFFDQQPLLACSNCGGHLSEPWAFYVNEYMRGQKDRQYYGQVCSDCAPAVAEDWSLVT